MKTWKTRAFARNAVLTCLLAFLAGCAPTGDPGRDEAIQKYRQKIRDSEDRTYSPIQPGDRPENLVDELRFTSLETMERAGLREASLKDAPWSDSYWPIYAGILANRYSDPKFPASMDWKANSDYLLQHLGKGDEISKLSPAEKYDLLIGDPSYGLTRQQILAGEPYFRNSGSVESWMGICHGWAPASFMMSRPENTVRVVAADGTTELEFRPSDIKALASLLWAETNPPTRFIGGRCNDEMPSEDEEGRFVDPDCLDTNPGTWHLAIVNQLGHSRRSFVMDATATSQVWNHPVTSYNYQYFNPETEKDVATLAEARVELANYPEDKFKKVRSASAVAIVGIEMEVRFRVETSPSLAEVDSVEFDRASAATYRYDLEINSEGRIVGGEWRGYSHPDFLWTPSPSARALSIGDRQVRPAAAPWNVDEPLPETWRKAAASSSRYGQPLAHVVEELIRRSQLAR